MSSAPKVPYPAWPPPVTPPKRLPHGAVVLDRPATIEDLDDLPETWRGEVIEGTMYAFPRPSAPHQEAGGTIFEELRPPFQRGRGGPGGWRILAEPGIRLQGTHEFSPDVAGWRLERLPTLPQKGPIRVVPDWACEVQSPSTRSYDLGIKRRFYAKIGVQYLWYVDPFARTLIASRLVDGQWLEIGAFCDNEKVRVEPFEAIELDLSAWWEGVAPEDAEEPSPSPPSSSL